MRRIALPGSGKRGSPAVSAGLLAGGRLVAGTSVSGEAAVKATGGADGRGSFWGSAGGKGAVAAAGVVAVATGTKRATRKALAVGTDALIEADTVSVANPATGLMGATGLAAATGGASTGLAGGSRGSAATGGGVGAAGAGGEAGMGSVVEVVAELFSLATSEVRAAAAALSSILPVPLSSQGREISGKAPMIRCTTSRLGLLRSLRMWLTTGRPTPIRSANWVGESSLLSSSCRMRVIIANLLLHKCAKQN